MKISIFADKAINGKVIMQIDDGLTRFYDQWITSSHTMSSRPVSATPLENFVYFIKEQV